MRREYRDFDIHEPDFERHPPKFRKHGKKLKRKNRRERLSDDSLSVQPRYEDR
jgi:hypothetical protein